MITYQLYDDYGCKIHEYTKDADDCSTIVLEYQNQYYRPITYDLNSEPHLARCIPIKVIHCRGAEENDKPSI